MTDLRMTELRKTSTTFLDDLNGAIRQNPVSATLIGAGVLWMIFGSNRISAFGGQIPAAARNAAGMAASSAQAGARAVADGVSAASSQVTQAAKGLGDSVSGTMHGMMSNGGSAPTLDHSQNGRSITNSFEDMARYSTDKGREFASSMQTNLAQAFERQPLLVGAVGLAIGAGIASAFQATGTENQLMGEASDAARKKAQDMARQTADSVATRAMDVVDQGAREAEILGLTPSGAKGRLHGLVDKLQTVGTSTREAIKSRLS